jgi:CDP-diacylglycerol pyrophosphatase
MSLNARTLFSVFVAVVVSATGHVSAQKAASKVNYCLSSALQITSVQDLKNVVFEECIHQQIKNEEVSDSLN